ncbi:aminopeptidase P family protein [Enterobacteriaceae bacterium H20N1]|uniref:Aminopeptidase P family protein n=1 Tax=Dryocola boscaweniae TaxID=2925397 RepID=A0A9X3AQ55_9ENTR|nr:aminopeptidase P family protein [Dryocola boscaweniae]MCT4702140.1 aminopeptidase P family protein [Dryocola boscaweniae]MCT4719416.1 aminopeptidase P family protein [Dryocola boscaweniae]
MQSTCPLSALRNLLKARELDGMLIPRADAHQSEDCAPHDNKLEFISGFTGSAGLALILADRALLFVDGRYQVQARHQVDLEAFEIHHLHEEPIHLWLRDNLPAGKRIAFEPLLMVNSQYENLRASGCDLVAVNDDPLNDIWPARPAAPCGLIKSMPDEISGESSANKRQRVAAALTAAGADYLALTLPDNIAWLLNVRGSDIAMNPVPHSFALVKNNGDIEWFVAREKLHQLSDETLSQVTLASPEDFLSRCEAIAADKRIWLDGDYAPVAVRFAVEAGHGRVIWQPDPITLMKANKNEVELAGYRASHIDDGAAWVNFLAWLSHEVPLREAAGNPITELEAQEKQLEFRKLCDNFQQQSFSTISAAGSNAAMCHYHSSPETNHAITGHEFYLNDSGGQYTNGTTDATRTLSFGQVDAQRRLHYTAVLKGFLALITLQFPQGAQGHQLDAFARRPLWELGLDYDHGTGHGVGHNLLIHENPHRMAKKVNPWPLLPGNILTIEPGYYLDGSHGIRIENQVEVVASQPGFCKFASLTLIPVDLSAVDLSLLNEQEIAWLDEYHLWVRETLSPRVSSEARPWLFEATAPVRARLAG